MDKQRNPTKQFKEIKEGAFFEFNNETYVKLDSEKGMWLGGVKMFKPEQEVKE